MMIRGTQREKTNPYPSQAMPATSFQGPLVPFSTAAICGR